jgi:tetratricopeptide (TPR) repeat protein
MKSGLVIFLLIFLSFSCNRNRKPYQTSAIELNNKASELIIQSKSDSALILLEKAIEIDENYFVAYQNMSSIYCSKQEYSFAINAMEKVVELKPEHAESQTFLGVLYDYTNQTENAKSSYLKALSLYNNRLKSNSKQSNADHLNKIYCLHLIGDSLAVNNEIIHFISLYPNDTTAFKKLKTLL